MYIGGTAAWLCADDVIWMTAICADSANNEKLAHEYSRGPRNTGSMAKKIESK